MPKCKIAIVNLMLGYKKTGVGSVGLWILEALKERHELHLITTGTVDFRYLNECWGTSIEPDEIHLVKLPQFFSEIHQPVYSLSICLFREIL